MLRYLVTGGAGFIGSALVRALLDQGDNQVEVVDDLSTGHERNLTEVRDRIDFHNVDVRDRESLTALFRGVDTIFHLAAIPSVPRSIKEPILSHEVNVDGTFNVYHAAATAGVRRVIYGASSSAYGDTPTLPKTENMVPAPKSPYAAQKLAGEHYASVFHSCFGLETMSLRFFNVYGPRQDPASPYSGVLSLFMKHLLARTCPAIFGDGEQTRDFTYVEDVADLCLKAAGADSSVAAGQTYNGGNGNRHSLNFVWELLQSIEGVRIPAKFGPPREGDVRDSMADTTAVVAALGHAPRFPIEDGLKRTLEWYKAKDQEIQVAV